MSEPTPAAIAAANIRRIRKSRGLSVQALVDKANATNSHPTVTRDSIFSAELGRTRLSIDNLVAIANAFDMEPGQLLAIQGCERCLGAPPPGFTCNDCGREAP